MPELTAKRTLVKSPPELWEELSEVERLAKHLGAFGEIKITKLDPEHTVAWEGEHASGTVSIEPSGWGTRVTLTAELPGSEPAPGEAAAKREDHDGPPQVAEEATSAVEDRPAAGAASALAEPDPVSETPADEVADTSAVSEPTLEAEAAPGLSAGPPRRRSFWSRLFPGWRRAEWWRPPAPEPEQAPSEQPEALPASESEEPEAAAHESSPEELEPEVPRAAPKPIRAEPASQIEVTVTGPDESQAVDEPATIDPQDAQSVLDRTLDDLGSAHHRPFSRG
jgi:hypothetical protein